MGPAKELRSFLPIGRSASPRDVESHDGRAAGPLRERESRSLSLHKQRLLLCVELVVAFVAWVAKFLSQQPRTLCPKGQQGGSLG